MVHVEVEGGFLKGKLYYILPFQEVLLLPSCFTKIYLHVYLA